MKLTTIRSILSIVATKNIHLEQLDDKTMFLHGNIEEDIYMIKPQGYIMLEKEQLVCKAQEKSLWLETGSKAVISEV